MFFFSSRRRYTRCSRDWSSDVCSSDLLSDAEIRQGIKQFANWPTIPQLYVNGEFVGGSDIMREMYESGELQKLLEPQKRSEERRVGKESRSRWVRAHEEKRDESRKRRL